MSSQNQGGSCGENGNLDHATNIVAIQDIMFGLRMSGRDIEDAGVMNFSTFSSILIMMLRRKMGAKQVDHLPNG